MFLLRQSRFALNGWRRSAGRVWGVEGLALGVGEAVSLPGRAGAIATMGGVRWNNVAVAGAAFGTSASPLHRREGSSTVRSEVQQVWDMEEAEEAAGRDAGQELRRRQERMWEEQMEREAEEARAEGKVPLTRQEEEERERLDHRNLALLLTLPVSQPMVQKLSPDVDAPMTFQAHFGMARDTAVARSMAAPAPTRLATPDAFTAAPHLVPVVQAPGFPPLCTTEFDKLINVQRMRGRPDLALETFEIARETGTHLDVRLYTSVISALAQGGEEEAAVAEKLFQECVRQYDEQTEALLRLEEQYHEAKEGQKREQESGESGEAAVEVVALEQWRGEAMPESYDRERRFTPQLIEKLARKLGQERRLRVLMGVKPTVQLYTAMLQCYVQTRQLDKAWHLVREVLYRAVDVEAEAAHEGELLELSVDRETEPRSHRKNKRRLGKEIQAEAALEKPDVAFFSCFLHACLREGRLRRAWEAFEVMRTQFEVQPDAVAYTLMMDACARERPGAAAEKALVLYEEMQGNGVEATEATYNVLIRCCARRKDYAKHCFVILEWMKGDGFMPDVVTYAGLLQAAASLGDIQACEMVLEQMEEADDVEVTVNSYAPLLTAMSRVLDGLPANRRQSETLHQQRRDLIEAPNALSWEKPRPVAEREWQEQQQRTNDVLRRARAVFSELEEEVAFLRQVRDAEAAAQDPRSYAISVSSPSSSSSASSSSSSMASSSTAAASTSQMMAVGAEVSLDVVDPAARVLERQDMTTFLLNSYLSVFVAAQRIKSCQEVFGKFAAYGLEPDVVTYNQMVKVYVKTKRMEDALDMYVQMKQHLGNAAPTSHTYKHLINGCAKVGYCNNAIQLLRLMKSKQMPIEKDHFHMIFKRIRHQERSDLLMHELRDVVKDVAELQYYFTPLNQFAPDPMMHHKPLERQVIPRGTLNKIEKKEKRRKLVAKERREKHSKLRKRRTQKFQKSNRHFNHIIQS